MDRIDMLKYRPVDTEEEEIFILDALATELSWCGVRDCLGFSGQWEVAKPDIAGSHVCNCRLPIYYYM